MSDKRFLEWPFFEAQHRELSEQLEAWCRAELPRDHSDVDATCIQLVRDLGKAGFLEGTAGEHIDVRSLCLIRETLARHDGLADFSFAMQGWAPAPSAFMAAMNRSSGWVKPVVVKRSRRLR
ncbi:hypothetical protein HSBAA_20360 [Vreelandella sulfidaeris]|uniref:Acyl-CoA dehydrogenase/oxidase N-terminal domain-containing protein n=1 Tax=Vreelandella sulfidaeris TaxID=115553 RepID=A0A455U3S7_9GAMM|nr:hypothetical protein HSBAA_20360 [Halomonas sulfidaeris]